MMLMVMIMVTMVLVVIHLLVVSVIIAIKAIIAIMKIAVIVLIMAMLAMVTIIAITQTSAISIMVSWFVLFVVLAQTIAFGSAQLLQGLFILLFFELINDATHVISALALLEKTNEQKMII